MAVTVESRDALELWDAGDAIVTRASSGDQDVFAFAADGRRRYLRLTPDTRRDGAAVAAEVQLVRHLSDERFPVAAPVPSRRGAYVEVVGPPGRLVHATVFEEAPGDVFRYDPAADNREHFRQRGQLLGRLHTLTRRFARDAPNAVAPIPPWNGTGWVAAASRCVPDSDTAFWSELEAVTGWARTLPTDEHEFGPIHGDFGATNYRVAGETLTLFDFGDACRHWFAHDVAISVYPYGERSERHALLAATLEGYRTQSPVPADWAHRISWFCRLRLLHMYVVYAERWGIESPMPQHAEWFARKRERMLDPVSW